MRQAILAGIITVLLAGFSGTVLAGERPPLDPDEQLRAMNEIVDELKNPAQDLTDNERVYRGERVNQAFVMLTGEAINPLFGITILGMYNYIRTDEALRDSLPVYDQPVVWVPLLIILVLMLFNSTICEAVPFLKVPLNALGDIVNKAGAVAILPLVVKMFADAVAQPAAQQFVQASSWLFPTAYAGETSTTGYLWLGLGWVAGALVGTVVYLAVWMTFNVIDVLILICPFPGVDALLKSFRLSIIGLLAGTNYVSPTVALVIAVAVVLISLLLAGWSFRLSVFGLIFSTDILFFRRKTMAAGQPALAFSAAGMKERFGIPMRTLGRLETTGNGELAFSYRPWLVLPRRIKTIGKPGDFACGIGLFNPFLVEDSRPDAPWLRLPPRYGGAGEGMVEAFGLRREVNCGVAGSLRTWLKAQFRDARTAA